MPQPLAQTAVLALLPAGVRALDLQCDCRGLVLRMLRRFPCLQELVLGGNANFADWRGAPALAPKLRGQLTIDSRLRRTVHGYDTDEEVCEVPGAILAAVPQAAGLHSLQLDCAWDDESALCRALPALRTLR